jgi:hypothetical protein
MTSPDDLQSWLDKNALAELVAVLSSAVDRGDKDRIAACYAAESSGSPCSTSRATRGGATSPTTGRRPADSTIRATTGCVGLADRAIRAGRRPNRED